MLGSFTMLTGTVVTAVIVSQVSVLMASLQASERQYVNKLSHVNVTMEKLSVPRRHARGNTQFHFTSHASIQLHIGMCTERLNSSHRHIFGSNGHI